MERQTAISVRGVSKIFKIYNKPQDRLKQTLFRGKRRYYTEFSALNDISFDVYKGETIGIIGRNGSGKSTLLQIIAGTLNSSKGTVEVNGRVAALLELGSGFNPEFTGRENVYMNGSILGLDKEHIDHLYPKILEFADIGDFIDQPVKTYSSGMSVRLAFAVQAMVPKEVLIVDEALAVGDELFQRKCYAKIEEFKNQGGTILFVSHSASSIIELCDRAVLIDSGEMLLVDRSKKVVNLYQKLIYAPSDKRERLKEEIRNVVTEDRPNVMVIEKRSNSADDKEMFDSNLNPIETVQYETRGAQIFDSEITTLSGEKVNLLKTGSRYVWRYYVNFTQECYNVRFGMMIKTISGLDLGGAATSLASEGIPLVQPGQTIKVEFTFSPRLNAGMYFLNGGVLGITDDGEVYLDRRIDLAAFKILQQEGSLITSTVDFGVTPNISY
ncbi:ABC transporter ATP-binding protein [Cohnella luojiensis]|uniref:ABC transporter ATP-binding protein n=1 Tax=Cohnella luojiensis TaxID=652876 RepID=A0A4Y8M1L2_9BACL|nr:ABC transporter ATP-binding protein [Cohnella luojiensis]TFE29003.1 ABC transporter ATP-binding protein [Cohnella luojiensis]